MNALKTVAVAVLVSGRLAAPAQAQEKSYLGAGFGQSDIDKDITSGFITSGPVDGKDLGSKLFGGFRFGSNLALELAYVDLRKAGLFAWEAKASDLTGGVPFSAKADDVTLSLGVGANYYVTRNVAVRIEWEHFDLDPDKARMLSAGLVVKF